MKTKHYQKITKRVFTKLWDSLPDRERDLIAADVDKVTELSKWFYRTVEAGSQARYEDVSDPMNVIESWPFQNFGLVQYA